ncbi:hypothetical protein Za10_0020 [Zymomonas mobilis subsp. mobilis NCIMB 11163]|nr:hypothetical protein Za10_0020 [Zymomonas mobilis subsp. mobilis NCIMB 11163]
MIYDFLVLNWSVLEAAILLIIGRFLVVFADLGLV